MANPLSPRSPQEAELLRKPAFINNPGATIPARIEDLTEDLRRSSLTTVNDPLSPSNLAGRVAELPSKPTSKS